jgi:DNA-binding MarR family transcriptional regulator
MTVGPDGQQLDPLIHAPARLRIMVTLSRLDWHDTLSFPRLQDLLGLTAGNLVTHLRKLEQGTYVDVGKSGDGTTIALTVQGRAALQAYTTALQKLLEGVPDGTEES